MTVPSTLPRAGLFTRDGARAPVPLTGVSVDAELSSICARVVVTQRYVNREKDPIEAVYVFPLDEGAAVTGAQIVVDDTLVVAEVAARDRAFEIYDDAIQQGHGAFLVDEERPDVFQASVGNLPPGKEVLLKITYVTELNVEGRGLRFAIPTTVSPRYAPAEDRSGVGRPDAEVLNPQIEWNVPYGLNLSVRIAMPGAISRVESPSHPISVSMNGDCATVTLSQREAAMDRDFVLSIETDALDTPQAWSEADETDGHAVSVTFVPRLGDAVVAGELIFLVDRSGSMGGTSIDEVRNALQLCLRSMRDGCKFNIVGFGSTYQALFEKSRAYDQASLAEAAAHVAGLDADLGGTEILPALGFVLGQACDPDLPRQVIVLTDGEVTNTDAVLALAAEHRKDARVFTFGIGAGASQHLVRGLARAGGGAAEFIFPGERVEPKVMRQVARLLSPALVDVQVDWGGLEVSQAPSAIPPVFAGDRLILYGFVENPRPATVRLTGRGPGGPFSFDVPFDPARTTTGRIVATLAARARIRELEEGSEWLAARGSRQKGRTESRVRQEIVALSTRYGVVSRETSFVAVERRDTPVHGDLQLRRVPIALTTGWGALDRPRPAAALGAPPRSMAAFLAAPAALARGAYDAVAGRPPVDSRHMADTTAFESIRSVRTPPATGMHALIALQDADGSWDLTAKLARVLGLELKDLKRVVGTTGTATEEARRAWATALALAWLRKHAADSATEWRMLAAKAESWLENVAARPPGGVSWQERAEQALE